MVSHRGRAPIQSLGNPRGNGVPPVHQTLQEERLVHQGSHRHGGIDGRLMLDDHMQVSTAVFRLAPHTEDEVPEAALQVMIQECRRHPLRRRILPLGNERRRKKAPQHMLHPVRILQDRLEPGVVGIVHLAPVGVPMGP